MLGSTTEQGRLYLTADQLLPEPRLVQSKSKVRSGLLLTQFHHFPPIEDLAPTLDRIASRGIPA
jgi:hypothetical protein